MLATPLAGKHMATVMMTHVLVKCGKYWHRLESLSQTSQGRGETFSSYVLCFCVPPVPSDSKPQVAVLAGKGVLVTYAIPVQHHHEVPATPPSAPTDPGDSGQACAPSCCSLFLN